MAQIERVAGATKGAEAILINGMPNWRDPGGPPRRALWRAPAFEAAVGMSVIASDTALYRRMLQTLGVAPIGEISRRLNGLRL